MSSNVATSKEPFLSAADPKSSVMVTFPWGLVRTSKRLVEGGTAISRENARHGVRPLGDSSGLPKTFRPVLRLQRWPYWVLYRRNISPVKPDSFFLCQQAEPESGKRSPCRGSNPEPEIIICSVWSTRPQGESILYKAFMLC